MGSCDEVEQPIMAHPPCNSSDLSFETFWKLCLREARQHLKLDFKDLKSIQRCIPTILAGQQQLKAQRQAVWINADILPGPNRRHELGAICEHEFFEAIKPCFGIPLSLGWRVAAGPEGYDLQDVSEMCRACEGYPSDRLVFAASARLALDTMPLLELLKRKAGSQLLIWTGTGEAPITWCLYRSLAAQLQAVRDRVGYDCQVETCSQAVAAIVRQAVKAIGGLCWA